MAITESHPARPGGGDPPTEQTSVSRRRSRWRGPVVLGLGALLTAAVVVLAVLAGTYQPVQFGGESGAGFPGLPTGTGIHFVNTFGGQQGELYVPPQAGIFTLKVSVYNTGPETVTIEAISILSPQEQASEAQGTSPWPLTPAGQVLWLPMSYRPDQAGNSVVGLSLTPGQDVVVGIPLRMSGICYDPSGWTIPAAFYVKERFGFFTHWVAVPFQPSLIMHEPSDPGGPGAEPARDIVCPAGTTK